MNPLAGERTVGGETLAPDSARRDRVAGERKTPPEAIGWGRGATGVVAPVVDREARSARPRTGVMDRVRSAYANAGLRGVWFGGLATAFYRRLLVLERRLDVPPPASLGAAELRIEVLAGTHAYEAYRQLRHDQSRAEFLGRMAAGAECFAALLDGRVVGATWARVGGGWSDYLGRALPLQDDEVFLFDTLVEPSFRGRRIAPRIAAAQIERFRTRGLARLVATVLPENGASLRARARTGFVRCGRLGWVGVGRWRREIGRLERRPAPSSPGG